jgi:hypothetical protein
MVAGGNAIKLYARDTEPRFSTCGPGAENRLMRPGRVNPKEPHMGMRISSPTSANVGAAQGGAAAWQQRQQSFKDLSSALQSGNLDAAKTAFASLTQNAKGQAASNPGSPLAQLGKALQSGDLAGAQQAFAAVQSQHHGHHHGAGASPAPAAAPAAGSGSGSVINLVA